MEKIPTIKLQELANMLYQEQNVSLRNQLSAWATANATNPEHASLSSLAAMSEQSSIKDKILAWVSNLTTPKPNFTYPDFIPDIPAQMEELWEGEKETLPEEIVFEIPMKEVIDEPVIEIPKKPRKKKED